jgi:hypothetical protein
MKLNSNNTHRNLVFVIVVSFIFLPISVFALDEGTTIIGTKEAPNVLNVVPWQDDEFGDPWKIQPEPTRSVLENSQKSLDKDVLRREIEYFNLLRNTGPSGP